MRAKLPLITAIIMLFAFTKGADYACASEVQPEIIMQTPADRSIQSSEEAWEIVQANSMTMDNKMSGVVDVTLIIEMSAEEIRKKIDENFISDAAVYLDGVLRKDGDLDPVIARRNVSALTDPVQLQYGVLTKNTAVRAYPSWQKLSDSIEEDAADYFQKSVFLIGEGVVVLHQTEDGIWSFVQGINDSGWIETEDIAFCRREEMASFSDSDSFVIVTEETLLVGSQEFRMGTKLPLSRIEGNSAAVWMPESNDNGNLYQTEFWLNTEGGIHIGNMELNVDNVMKQAYKVIDVGYASGDAEGLMDEGSVLNSIYRCFGIILPRDVEKLMYAGASITDISMMEAGEKTKFIIEQGPGCLLQMDDHAALYLGLSAEGKPKILHSTEQYSLDGINVVDAYRCVVTPLETYTSDGISYLDSYHYLIDFNLPGFQ